MKILLLFFLIGVAYGEEAVKPPKPSLEFIRELDQAKHHRNYLPNKIYYQYLDRLMRPWFGWKNRFPVEQSDGTIIYMSMIKEVWFNFRDYKHYFNTNLEFRMEVYTQYALDPSGAQLLDSNLSPKCQENYTQAYNIVHFLAWKARFPKDWDTRH